MTAGLGIRRRARRLWREYTRMRTAILFLIGLVLIVLVGSFVPQQDTSAQAKVDDFLAAHANLNALATHLGLPPTQVFVSPLLYVLLGSLYIALAACVIRRGRALAVRTVRGYPRTPQYWGEWGSWLFHTSFFLLLIAVVWGKSTGFEGIMTITEGQTATEARSSYDSLREGVLFDGHHSGFQVRLNSFHAGFQPNGQPADFVSNVTVLRDGHEVTTKDVRVNDFLAYDGVDMYQQDYGLAPHIVVRNPAGAVVYDGDVQFFGTDKSAQVGVLKVPSFGYTIPGSAQPVQVGARLVLFPDARSVASVTPGGAVDPTQLQYGPGGEQPRNPVIEVQLFVGDLGLRTGRPQNVNELDTSAMQPYFSGAASIPLALGDSRQLPLRGTDCRNPAASGCFTVSFPSLPAYSLFHVKRDSGVPFVYVSFGLVMAGLLTKLYLRPALEARARRRRTAAEPDYAWLASVAGEGDVAAEEPSAAGRASPDAGPAPAASGSTSAGGR